MKIFISICLTMIFSLALFAQSYRVYIQVTYNPVQRTAVILLGDEVLIPKDKSGKPRQFDTSMVLLNWLSKKGWHLEPIEIKKQDNKGKQFYRFQS